MELARGDQHEEARRILLTRAHTERSFNPCELAPVSGSPSRAPALCDAPHLAELGGDAPAEERKRRRAAHREHPSYDVLQREFAHPEALQNPCKGARDRRHDQCAKKRARDDARELDVVVLVDMVEPVEQDVVRRLQVEALLYFRVRTEPDVRRRDTRHEQQIGVLHREQQDSRHLVFGAF